ncbi:hypothetical protein EUX98_g8979 [Antrodiella citrinella]|uniref:DUF6699 domain-containing protein n=1 Tax=Antrodiella citrinella TaxID=2447956 RepID=A0A4S4M023_9APHY|nr:hypothetical protein EUX98_g8979 [Antrodiella citrinella]
MSSTASSKHVRWSDENQSYDAPRTPSPTHSHSSGTSSPGPMTPSPPSYADKYLHPHQYTPKPPPTVAPPLSARASERTPSPLSSQGSARTPSPLQPNVYLHPNLVAADLPSIPWILTQDVSVIASRLLQPATNPPSSAVLPIIHPDYMWTIRVSKGEHGYGYVTVGDVLTAIAADIKTRVTHNEYNAMRTDPRRAGMQQQVDAAFAARCTSREVQKNGVLRVDFLRGKLVWKGLLLRNGRVELQTARH